MSRRRIVIGMFLASCIAAFAVAPFPAMGAELGTGKTSTDVDLVKVRLTNVPTLGTLNANLGVASSHATTEGEPVATLVLDGIRVGNQIVSAHQVSSENGDESESVSIPIGAAGIGGQLTVADMRAEATADSALALLSALSGNVDIGPLGFASRIGDNGIVSSVTPTEALSRAGASFGPVELRLGDLLPEELMAALPLSALLDLIDELGLQLPVNVADQVQVIRDLVAVLEELEAKITELVQARDDLDALVSDNPAVQAAQDAVDAAQAAVDAAQAQLTAAQQTFAETEAGLTAAQTELAAAQQELAAAQSQLASLTAEMDALEAEKAELQAQLATCSLQALCNELLAQIAAIDAEMAALQPQIDAAQAAVADAAADVATAQAAVDSAQAAAAAAQAAMDEAQAAVDAAQAALASAQEDLTAAVNAIVDPIVDQALALIEQIKGEINNLLVTLEDILGDVTDLTAMFEDLLAMLSDAPLFEIGEITVSVQAAADQAAGVASVTCGASGIEILGNPVAGASCDTLSGAFGEITAAVQGVLDSLPISGVLPKVTVAGLEASSQGSEGPDASGVTSATASLSALHIGIGSVSLTNVVDDIVADALAMLDEATATLPINGVAIGATLQSVIDDVTAQLSGLPIGDTLEGLDTVGVDATVAGLRTMASYQARAPRQDRPRDPSNPDTHVPPAAQPPAERAPLPFTGSSTSLVVAIALWLMAAGMVLTFISYKGMQPVKETSRH